MMVSIAVMSVVVISVVVVVVKELVMVEVVVEVLLVVVITVTVLLLVVTVVVMKVIVVVVISVAVILGETAASVMLKAGLAVIDTSVEILTFDLLTDALAVIIRGVLTNEFAMPGPLGCSAAFDCRPMTALNRDCVLQARMPSYHV